MIAMGSPATTPTLRIVPEPRRTATPGAAGATAPSARGARLRLTRRGRAVVTALAVGLALAAGSVAQHASARTPGEAVEVTAYTVASGETLWQIASAITDPGEDVREAVAVLMQLNGLTTSGLNAGQQLLLPAS